MARLLEALDIRRAGGDGVVEADDDEPAVHDVDDVDDVDVGAGGAYPSHVRPVEVQRLQAGFSSSQRNLRILCRVSFGVKG